MQVHDQGAATEPPLTPLAVSFAGHSAVGAVAVPTLFAAPQTVWVAEQLADAPPYTPLHCHDHGPDPLGVLVGVPALQRLLVGAEMSIFPLVEELQTPGAAAAAVKSKGEGGRGWPTT